MREVFNFPFCEMYVIKNEYFIAKNKKRGNLKIAIDKHLKI